MLPIANASKRRVYLDYNATCPVRPVVRQALLDAWDDAGGNPSSSHQEGRRARALIEKGRLQVAELLNVDAEDLFFTSGGTEADFLGVIGLGRLGRMADAPLMAVSPTAHPAILGAAKSMANFEVITLDVDHDGLLELSSVDAAIARGCKVFAVEMANHETGVIQPVEEITKRVGHDGWVHCDAVQAVGKMAVDPEELGVASLALSGHKLGAPKGAGALWVRPGITLPPVHEGGHHERGRRPGTENVIGIYGMGIAAKASKSDDCEIRLGGLRDDLEARVCEAIPGVTINGVSHRRMCNTSNLHISGALAVAVQTALDVAGFAVSTGAACTSGVVKPSTVLTAMGRDNDAGQEAIRVSFGWGSVPEDVARFVNVLPKIVETARAHR